MYMGLMLKDIVMEWNAIDRLLYNAEQLVEKIKEIVLPKEPDVELMIEIETDYLKKENERLKELYFPKKIIRTDKGLNYLCPNGKCGIEIPTILVEQYKIKFCPECGQRIYINISAYERRKCYD